METHTFTKKEEVANAITHGIGVLLSIAALVILVVNASMNGGLWDIISVSIYGASMIFLYLSSTLVHAMPPGKWKDRFEVFDHAAIYLFIAGTYTPILLLLLGGTLGWTLFGVVWGIAIGGVFFKMFFVKRFVVLSTVFYLLMGWIIVFAWNPLVAKFAFGGLVLLIIGGVLYSLGTIFYVWRSFTFHHAVWHIFVMAGTIVHFFAIFIYIL
ncbi:PAQR family membrane homeostasis protein TrhA [Pontibacillus yanchengensis]|uniref:Hemolysin D n=1 Tax=Pontibacillus yanchengensis Y32 TaxID=1385514 RepID=A0A0A2T7G1_9BACI|nr:hemolysin III family protein [Pontibacillus yanchengensis]KGP71449.1 hemolysin D [Pontibacillus yanchengensis Y32]